MSTSPDEISLTPEQKALIARMADTSGRPWDAIVADALSSLGHTRPLLATPGESVYDAMARLGFLGCIKDAPADLSTNPAYMQGFGENGNK